MRSRTCALVCSWDQPSAIRQLLRRNAIFENTNTVQMSLLRSLFLGLLISTAAATAAHAQKFVPAYLVTASSDTLGGELLQESIAKNSLQVKFKPQGSDIKS